MRATLWTVVVSHRTPNMEENNAHPNRERPSNCRLTLKNHHICDEKWERKLWGFSHGFRKTVKRWSWTCDLYLPFEFLFLWMHLHADNCQNSNGSECFRQQLLTKQGKFHWIFQDNVGIFMLRDDSLLLESSCMRSQWFGVKMAEPDPRSHLSGSVSSGLFPIIPVKKSVLSRAEWVNELTFFSVFE